MVRSNPWKLLKDTKTVPKEETVTQLKPLVWKLHEDRLKGDIRSYINKYRASDQKMFLLKFIGKFWKELQGFKNERSWYVCGRSREPQYFVHVEIVFRALVYATVYLGVHFLLHSALIKFEINSQKNYTPDTQGINGFSSAVEKGEDKNLQKCDTYVLEAKQMYLKMI